MSNYLPTRPDLLMPRRAPAYPERLVQLVPAFREALATRREAIRLMIWVRRFL